MSDVFTCPECGRVLEIEGHGAGREVQCEECSTFVEVPFFPRLGGRKRGRSTASPSPWKSKGVRAALVFAVVTLLGLAAIGWGRGRVRSGREQVLAELLTSANEAEAARRYDVALREIEGALAQAKTFEPERSPRLAELRTRRDRISLREAESRLGAVEALPPDQAVGESLILADRARRDPALAPLAEAIAARVDDSRHRQAEGDLALARRELEAHRDPLAFQAAERLYDRAGLLPESDARAFQDEARAVMEAAVSRSGVALPEVSGRFVVGSIASYTTLLDRHRAEAFRVKGYFPQPRRSRWAMLWDEKAPFRSTVQVVETQEEYYLQSRNRTTLTDGTIELFRDDRPIWKTRAIGRTRSPLPDLPAYLAGHLATSDKHRPEVERRLHADALLQFVEQAVKNCRSLPDLEKASQIP